MKIQNIIKLSVIIFILSGCAMIDKTLAPVDSMINTTKSSYASISNSTDETVNDLSHSVGNFKADFYESSLVKFFSDDVEILKNREKYFIKWDNPSNYSSKRIINKYLRDNNSEIKENDLELSQKMNILKDYFFDLVEKEYIKKFESKHKMVKFDQFLTDRENIENIYKYKTALTQSEHEWKMNIHDTQKRVATLMLSTMYAKPSLEYLSYDPYDEEIFLLIKSQKNGFKEKIKFEVEKDLARVIKKNIRNLKPSVYYRVNDDKLELVAISTVYKGKTYLANVVDAAYSRKSDIAFTSKEINLKKLDVDYTEVIRDIKPPEWYLTLKEDSIGYGQGMSVDEAKTNAYKNIAQSRRVKVNTQILLNDTQHGSVHSSSMKNKTNLESKDMVVENTRTVKEEKKDGIWFVAISY